jgi:hypothetical protein
VRIGNSSSRKVATPSKVTEGLQEGKSCHDKP